MNGNTKTYLALGIVTGLTLLPFAAVDVVPGNEVGIIIILGILGVLMILDSGGHAVIEPHKVEFDI